MCKISNCSKKQIVARQRQTHSYTNNNETFFFCYMIYEFKNTYVNPV